MDFFVMDDHTVMIMDFFQHNAVKHNAVKHPKAAAVLAQKSKYSCGKMKMQFSLSEPFFGYELKVRPSLKSIAMRHLLAWR